MSQENNNNNSNVQNTAPETEETKAPAAEKKGSMSPIKIVILILCVGVFAFSGYKIIGEFIDGSETDQLNNDLWESVRGDDAENEDDTVTENNENDVQPEQETNTDETPDSSESSDTQSEQPTENSGNNGSASTEEPEIYDDRTYEQELEDEKNAQQNSTTQTVTVSRPSSDKSSDSSTIGTVIAPQDIDVSSIPYLKASNLQKLLNQNDQTKGWIYFPGSQSEAKGTPIDTAIVQATDNEYYLTHSFDKSENVNGWIYADFRNNMESITSNYNTILYGHARSYKMFGGLKELNTSVDWYSNGYNHFIKINTFNDETIWQIFSWYETDVYFDYIKTDFESAEDFIRFAYEVQDKNQMTGIFETFEFTENDRILTLSTCKGLDRTVRVAVHAKLVSRNKLN